MRPISFRDRLGGAKNVGDRQDAWLITYADLITQLMCFFVMVLMVSEPKMDRLGDIASALGGGFVPTKIESPYTAFYDSTETWITQQGLEVEAAVEYSARGVVVDLGTDYLFEKGSAVLTPDTRIQLAAWAERMKALPWEHTTVSVVGYTDDIALEAGSPYRNAWELSAARAAAVVALLAENGLPKKHLQIVAYGDARPVVPNRTEGGAAILSNQARNRRVLLRVERNV
jgi:chemotaxis protein MotB